MDNYVRTIGNLVFFSSTKEQKEMTSLKKALPWLKEVDSTALQNSIQSLGEAFSSYYKKEKVNRSLKAEKMKSNRIHQNVIIANQGQRFALRMINTYKFQS